MLVEVTPRLRCRLIVEADRTSLVDLLRQGFSDRPRSYWERAFDHLARRDAPEGYPRFGYVLEIDGALVGVILTIFSRLPGEPQNGVRCNVSSWYVDSRYRSYASLLVMSATRYKGVVYINASPAPFTWRVIEAQGFTRYVYGQMLTFPALSLWMAREHAHVFDPERDYGSSLTKEECDLLKLHAEYGCSCFVVTEKRGACAHPFVFLRLRVLRGLLPAMQLIYCRDIADYWRFAGALGGAFARQGAFGALCDATDRQPGVLGKYFVGRGPKYFKGSPQPRLGDLANTEAVIFGL